MITDLHIEKSSEQRGIVSFAVLIFFAAILAVSLAMFMTITAVVSASQAFDAVRFQTAEKNGLAQVVEQSIIAARGTLTTNSALSVDQEIRNRLSALSLTPGVTLSLATSQPVPTHTFYPAGVAPALTSFAEYSSTDPGAIAGKGLRLFPLLEAQQQAYLGRSVFTFNRTVSANAKENRTYTVNADLYSIPLTNIPVVAYGLPNSTGNVPPSGPVLPGLIPSDARRLVMTSNNPARDSTAYPDYYIATTPEQWPAQFEPAALWSWDAYEYLWGNVYQNNLLSAAGPTATYDFSSPSNPIISGVSVTAGTIAIDLSAVTASTLAIVDSFGTGVINVQGTSTTNPAFILLIKNSGAQQTAVNVSGNNQRPFILVARNCALNFSGNPSLTGALLLDSGCTATGAATLFGHLSFFATSSLFPSWNLTVNGSSGYESAYATLAPRVLLVGTRGIR